MSVPPSGLVAAVRKLVGVVEHAVPPLQDFAKACCSAVLPDHQDRTLREALPATPDVEADLRAELGPQPLEACRQLVAQEQAAQVPRTLWDEEDARVRALAAGETPTSAAVYDATEREQRAARIALEWVQAFDLPSVADLVPCANRVYARLQELERLWRTLCKELSVDPEKARTNTLLALSRRAGHAATMALKDDVQVAQQLAKLLGVRAAGDAATVAKDVLRVVDELLTRTATSRDSEFLFARLRAATGEKDPGRIAEAVKVRLDQQHQKRLAETGHSVKHPLSPAR